MAQPDYVPVTPSDRVREGEPLPPAKRWTANRPGEIVGLRPPVGESFGVTGPDQGFGLKLAKRFAERLELEPTERADDAISGCLGIGLKRASMFGRAPVIHDFDLAFTVFGFLGGAPRDLIEFRRPLFEAASHHYWDQRGIVDAVRVDTLRLTPAQVRERLGEWRTLIDAGGE